MPAAGLQVGLPESLVSPPPPTSESILFHQALLLAPPAASQPLTITLPGEVIAGITVGATAGCLLLVLCACAFGCWCYRRQNAHEDLVAHLRAELRRMKDNSHRRGRGHSRSGSNGSTHELLSPSRSPSPTDSPLGEPLRTNTKALASSSSASSSPLSKEELAELERKRVAAAAAAEAAERAVIAREQQALAKEEAALLAAEEAELAAEEAAFEAELAASARAALNGCGPPVGSLKMPGPYHASVGMPATKAAYQLPMPPGVPADTTRPQPGVLRSVAPPGQLARGRYPPQQAWGYPQMQRPSSKVGTIRAQVYR